MTSVPSQNTKNQPWRRVHHSTSPTLSWLQPPLLQSHRHARASSLAWQAACSAARQPSSSISSSSPNSRRCSSKRHPSLAQHLPAPPASPVLQAASQVLPPALQLVAAAWPGAEAQAKQAPGTQGPKGQDGGGARRAQDRERVEGEEQAKRRAASGVLRPGGGGARAAAGGRALVLAGPGRLYRSRMTL